MNQRIFSTKGSTRNRSFTLQVMTEYVFLFPLPLLGMCSLAALLGASPGASVTVTAMLQVLEKCFAEEMASEAWKNKLAEMDRSK